MNPLSATIVTHPREDAFAELERLFWSLKMHCEVGERFAALGHREGIELALRDARQCFGAALVVVRESLPDGR